jgi:histidyl-tRNA synthetase
VLDCKVPACRDAVADAPSILDHLCPDCRAHFETLTETHWPAVDPYRIDPRLVRGLDYYTRTTFEIQTGSLGAQSAVVGGGRYDGLAKLLGGPETPATGFAIGFDRLTEIVGLNCGCNGKTPGCIRGSLGGTGQGKSLRLGRRPLPPGHPRRDGLRRSSLKAQMKRADRLSPGTVLIVGDNELESGSAPLRDMAGPASSAT